MNMNNEQIINIKSSANQLVSMFENNLEIDNEDVIFQIGDEFWTTEKLLDFIKVHPLVFRKTKMKKSEFPLRSERITFHYNCTIPGCPKAI